MIQVHSPEKHAQLQTHLKSLLPNQPDPCEVAIEFHSRFQIPSFQIIGLPGPDIQEAKERISSAFASLGIEFPKKKVVINLTPSHLKKTGRGLDLPMALSVLFSNRLPLRDFIFAWGELGLGGEIKPSGQMSKWIDYFLNLPQKLDSSQSVPTLHFYLSHDDAKEWQKLIEWRASHRLTIPNNVQLVALQFLDEALTAKPLLPSTSFITQTTSDPFHSKAFSEELLPLSPMIEKALLIALTGEHHLILLGPKGAGKSKALHWIQSLAPQANPQQTWERIRNYPQNSLEDLNHRPLRRVHAQIRPAHLLGSFNNFGFLAGELALAHGGYLIADEFLEWPRDSKEVLREPFEEKRYTLSRVLNKMSVSCNFQFVGTSNYCPCGGIPPEFAQGTTSQCRCHPSEVKKYWSKFSGPIADRIDLICFIKPESLQKNHPARPDLNTHKSIAQLRQQIKNAQKFAKENFGVLPAYLSPTYLEQSLYHLLTKHPQDRLEHFMNTRSSLRARHKLLKIAHTLWALEGSDGLKPSHLLEASLYQL